VRPVDLTPALRNALGGTLAVLLVALGIVALQLLVPGGGDSPDVVGGPGPAVVAEPPVTTAPPARGTTPPPATAAATSAPATTAPATPTTSPTAAARLALTVLNNSRINGLAKKAAADFAAAGWTVASTGNLSGRLALTTVYYPAGQRAAAEELRARFPAIRDMAPRYAGLPGEGTLTVVVTRDYPH
jgi:hypothetical protein